MPVLSRTRIAALAGFTVAAAFAIVPITAQGAVDACTAPVVNPVACENTLPGNPASEWDVSGSGSATIQGFTTDISVNRGQTVQFKISTPATSYRLDIYRMGYYGGSGARKVATVTPSATLPQSQPACLTQAATGLVDCGNWAVSASWAVPATSVSGVYFAKLVRTDATAGSSHVFFVVRDDASTADLLFQTSDTTWQAYNQYGGNSLYVGSPAGRAYKVSYNRPFTTRGTGPEDFVFNAEYPMIRFLEANGYDVAYQSGIDTDRYGARLRQHKAFLSVGHDEYWSGQQRANVEAARDAGVHLAFFSGNEIFWKTRYESSIDASATSYRTLVSYKETQANAKIDPSPNTWTGTWRDPRFSPPADGGRPENALSGQSFYVNSGTTNLQVPAADGKMRFWRNTSVANLAANATATLGTGTVGYEWDVEPDNGFRPRGLIRMSTTQLSGAQVLLDYGSSYGTGPATHNISLYKAPSGALVFGAGTVQWSWGLDSNHDRGSGAVSVPMQQATVNLFADMGAQPMTPIAGLTAATASTDTTPPTTAITSPAAGTSPQIGVPLAITGTATDVGGQVGGIEVSTDGGTSWHPATGRASWTYSWTPASSAAVTIQARATDDSGNVGPVASVALSGPAPKTCPCSIFPASATPATVSDPDTQAVELGTRFRADTDGQITAIRFYKSAANTGTHVGHLWTNTGTLLSTVTFTGETASGWQQATLPAPVNITANTTYVVSYFAPVGRYSQDTGFFTNAGYDGSPLRALRNGEDGLNGVYLYSPTGGFPTQGFAQENYWVDVLFTPAATGPDTTPPTVTTRTPASGATGVATTGTVSAAFSEAVQAATVSMTVTGPTGAVAGTTAYNAATNTATFTPGAPLAGGATYTVAVSGARDTAGNTMAPTSWTFTTATPPPPAACPCSLWPTSRVPGTPATTVTSARTLGVRFTADVAGTISGIRFYKGTTNTGTHVGRLWSSTGTQLATVNFTNETASGWQTATFSTPVAITAGTTYVASYYAPVGRYARDSGFFTGTRVDSGPLHAPADTAATGNGVYSSGNVFPRTRLTGSNFWVDVIFNPAVDTAAPVVSSRTPAAGATGVATSAPITATFNEDVQAATVAMSVTAGGSPVSGTTAYNAASRTATFTPSAPLAVSTVHTVNVSGAKDTAGNTMAATSWTFTTAAGDTTAPTVTTRTPAANATGVPISTTVTATFSEDVVPASVVVGLARGATTLTGATSYNAATRTVTFTPGTALQGGAVHTVTVTGARDGSGNTMTSTSWSFTTAASGNCPCTLYPGTAVPATVNEPDTQAVEVGNRFRSQIDGQVTAIRFYKGNLNTGTHVGHLWTNTGTLLATVTFTNETASGWQEATLSAPVNITANTTYVVSYYAPNGRYSQNANYFTNSGLDAPPLRALRNGEDGLSGVYRYGTGGGFPTLGYAQENYWVDVVFVPAGPDTIPPTVVSRTPAPATQGVAVDAPVTVTFNEAIDPASPVMTVTGPSGAVPGVTAYDPANRIVTFTPSFGLTYSTTYTASLNGAKDAAGNVMDPVTWTFATGAAPPPGPDQGPGGPVLVVKGGGAAASGFSAYTAEILRGEGLNAFTTSDITQVTPATLAAYDVVVLGQMPLSAAQVSMFTTWVNGGGNLIAFRPDAQLAGLLGLTAASGTVAEGYLGIDTATAPGAGITAQTMQFHGTADRYTLNGARAVATLYTTATTATANPAVTLRSVGTSGGEAAAFTFDLPRSIVYTRQGNPAWAGQERDAQAPIRSDDLFFGGGGTTDWVNLSKVAVPQADEQQRLLVNLIQTMNRDRTPLPRFWYFPRSLKAVVVATGDDHGNNGTAGRFDQYLAASPAGCSVVDWECPRFTSYMYPSTPLTNTQAANYRAQGFELATHVTSNCADYTPTSLAANFAGDLAAFRAKWPSLPSPTTNRLHCIVWSDWITQPDVEFQNGIRLDTNYYYWPGTWVQDRPGFMTGSGMPQRFADVDGRIVDVYQAATQMTDESGQTYPATPDALLDNALGANGYYGAFVANVHTDVAQIQQSTALLQSAQSRNVPIITAEQLLTWTDGRNGSSFSGITRNGRSVSFTVRVGTGANGLTAMMPTAGPGGASLTSLTNGGAPVAFTRQTVKGIEYAVFTATGGTFTATY